MTLGALAPARPSVLSGWTFHGHVAAWAVVGALAITCFVLLRRDARSRGARIAPRQLGYLAGGLVSLAIATTWPVADIAEHSSLTALLGQRLLLTLASAPLLLLALPSQILSSLTKPTWIDAALAFFTRPVVAVVTFSVIAIGTLAPGAVSAQASSPWARAGIDALLLLGGAVLWGPVLRHIPGAYRPTPVGAAVYLFVQSIVPTFPAVIFIFSDHQIYSTFTSTRATLGMSALGDQHLAGIVAKVATLPVLWTVAWLSLSRAQNAENEMDPYPLTWAEVERQLQRAERAEIAERRGKARRKRVGAIPRPVAGAWSAPIEATSVDPSGSVGPADPTGPSDPSSDPPAL